MILWYSLYTILYNVSGWEILSTCLASVVQKRSSWWQNRIWCVYICLKMDFGMKCANAKYTWWQKRVCWTSGLIMKLKVHQKPILFDQDCSIICTDTHNCSHAVFFFPVTLIQSNKWEKNKMSSLLVWFVLSWFSIWVLNKKAVLFNKVLFLKLGCGDVG